MAESRRSAGRASSRRARVSPTTNAQEQGIGRLLSLGERWGWEFRDRESILGQYPPAPRPAEPSELGAARKEVEDRKGYGFGCVFVGLWLGTLGGLALAALGGLPDGNAAPVVVPGAVVGGFVGPFVGRRLLQNAQKDYVAAREAWEAQKAEMMATWDRARAEWVSAVRQLPEWVPVAPASSRVSVFGGTHPGWRRLLTTLGTSLIGSGVRLTVLDLSEGEVADALVATLERCGRQVSVHKLAADASRLPIFAGMGSEEIRDVLTQALKSVYGQTAGEGWIHDERLLGLIIESLDPPISPLRLLAALRVLGRLKASAQSAALDRAEEPVPGLSAEERRRLSSLLPHEQRPVYAPSVARLEAHLEKVRTLGSDPAEPADETDCRCVLLTRSGTTHENQLLAELLAQSAIRGLRTSPATTAESERVLIVTGAEVMVPGQVEKLHLLAADAGVRLITLSRTFREAEKQYAGTVDASTVFMRLGNDDDARRAADFIGKEHRFVVSGRTTTRGTSLTRSVGESHSHSRPDLMLGMRFGLGHVSEGIHVGEAMSETSSTADSVSRVHEHIVEPLVLQELAPTAFLIVDGVRARRGSEISIPCADCDPELALEPKAALDRASDQDEQVLYKRLLTQGVVRPSSS